MTGNYDGPPKNTLYYVSKHKDIGYKSFITFEGLYCSLPYIHELIFRCILQGL